MSRLLRSLVLLSVLMTAACARPIVGGALDYESLDRLPIPDEVARAAVVPACTVSGTIGQATIVASDRVLLAGHCIESRTPMTSLADRSAVLNLVARGDTDQDWAIFDALNPLPPFTPVPLVSRRLRSGEIVFVVMNARVAASKLFIKGFDRRIEPGVVGMRLPGGTRHTLEGPRARPGDSGSLVMGYDERQARWVGVGLIVEGIGHQGVVMPLPPELIAAVDAPSPRKPSIDTLAHAYLEQVFAHPGIAPEDFPSPAVSTAIPYDISQLIDD